VARLGRPVGYVISAEERERIAVSQRARWARRRLWVEATRMIKEAIDDSNPALAHEILDAYMNTEQESTTEQERSAA
jgi:hypothetical protein